eukprot:gb/GECH01007149.1/.p1 GENE.gb/GECH01007149.1/~~gb/GECH01007149.1/.p1  ORF type:complete len:1013 (+),score=245.77 gb/GECH01007149.1/:1-3039(+)
MPADPETHRLKEDKARKKNWKRWGPYLSERQWGTVREDYSAEGDPWGHFPHEQARSRAYRWGEDGLLGICDRECRLCFGLALWNGKDPILKERLFGLTNPEGNHGEDVKELYYYVDSTPTHSYMQAKYLYPQNEYPYFDLWKTNQTERSRRDSEYEIWDTGVFDNNEYFTVSAEYAKASPEDLCIQITVENNGDHDANIHLVPTLWFRNTWVWGCKHEGCTLPPSIRLRRDGDNNPSNYYVSTYHETLGDHIMDWSPAPDGSEPELLFTNNETNFEKLYGVENVSSYVKDAFNRYVIDNEKDAVNPKNRGTKFGVYYKINVPAKDKRSIKLRLYSDASCPLPSPRSKHGESARKELLGTELFDFVLTQRIRDSDSFYNKKIDSCLTQDEKRVVRQAYAGLLWTKQFYHYVVQDWLEGDSAINQPPDSHKYGRNSEWQHVYLRDIISMPDKWEYPWFAAWDLAFHMIPFAKIDGEFTKNQLLLFLREWSMHPNGAMPAYEFNFSDVNPPVHAWAVWNVYKITGRKDTKFLKRCFHKLLLNFTWWVNRKDVEGKNLFAGGFLGLDNIGVFDRSNPMPGVKHLEQADGTSWMAFYCAVMLKMSLELASRAQDQGQDDAEAFEDMASKFLEHYVHIADAMNEFGNTGLWDEDDGFYYDQLVTEYSNDPMLLKLRSTVGLVPLFAVSILEEKVISKLSGFRKRLNWFLHYRSDLAKQISYMSAVKQQKSAHRRVFSFDPQQVLSQESDLGSNLPIPRSSSENSLEDTDSDGEDIMNFNDESDAEESEEEYDPEVPQGPNEPEAIVDGQKPKGCRFLLAIPSKEKLKRVMEYVLDENEFLSDYGVRSLSKFYRGENEYSFEINGQDHRVAYTPGESTEPMFGGNSNWRGPIWFPVNYLLITSLRKYHHFFKDDFRVECPKGSGNKMNLRQIAEELATRLTKLFVEDNEEQRPCNGKVEFLRRKETANLLQFHEYFNGDTGAGLGSSHQTGWSALVVNCFDFIAQARKNKTTDPRGSVD